MHTHEAVDKKLAAIDEVYDLVKEAQQGSMVYLVTKHSGQYFYLADNGRQYSHVILIPGSGWQGKPFLWEHFSQLLKEFKCNRIRNKLPRPYIQLINRISLHVSNKSHFALLSKH